MYKIPGFAPVFYLKTVEMKSRIVFSGLILMFLAGLFPTGLFAQLDGRGNAPDFLLEDVDGNEHHLYEYLDSGKVVMIDFFAVWCGICQSNTEVLDDIYKHYGPEGSDKIVLLSLEADDNSQDQEVINYRDTYNVTNPLINETLGTVADYNINGYPFYYIVAPDRSYKVYSGIEMNLEEKISLESVASHVGVSPYYFCKVFKQAAGMTLTEYVNRRRIEWSGFRAGFRSR